MGIDIVTMEDCASNYGVFKVTGSKGKIYTVSFNGSEGPAFCPCDGFKFHKDCRHIKEVYEKACLYNPQWHDSKEHPELRPINYTYTGFSSAKCRCGGPMVYVKRAV
jgi:hypothetical protein